MKYNNVYCSLDIDFENNKNMYIFDLYIGFIYTYDLYAFI